MPRQYVDNAMNRSLGRVGMSHGSAVHSSSSSYSGYSSSSSPRVYVDNSMNRNLGRVGMEHGTAVHSRTSTTSNNSSFGSPSTYVDNTMNRNLGRVGLPLGSAVQSRSSQSSYSSSSSYVDNVLNRSLGRVGLEKGTAIHSKSENTYAPRTYTDNAYNRRLGRVGKSLGSAVESRSTSAVSVAVNPIKKTYVDNAVNRRLGRVGMKLGSMAVSKANAKCDANVFDFNNDVCCYPTDRMYEKLPEDVIEEIENLINLKLARRDATSKKTTLNVNELEPKMIIRFEELVLGDKIGSGGFGDVHLALWKDQNVAVKKLRVQRVSQARKKQFEDEVRGIAGLDHLNIVKFYGACVVTPNLALVMELLLDGSLYDNLHYSEVQQFDEKTKNQLVCDMFSALQYVHSRGTVHRDIKSKNIMLFNDKSRCKLADFGLALKDDSESNASTKDFGFAGTEKYCPREVLDGERLNIDQLKLVDVYSLALTTVELLTEREPFDNCKNIHQIRKAIKDGELPTMAGCGISADKERLLTTALSKRPIERPSATGFLMKFKEIIAVEN